MAKKQTKTSQVVVDVVPEIPQVTSEQMSRPDWVVPTSIAKLAVDYPSEGLNNMAIKINEIIDRLNS